MTAAGTPWEHGSVRGRLTAGLIQPVHGWVVYVWVAGAGLLEASLPHSQSNPLLASSGFGSCSWGHLAVSHCSTGIELLLCWQKLLSCERHLFCSEFSCISSRRHVSDLSVSRKSLCWKEPTWAGTSTPWAREMRCQSGRICFPLGTLQSGWNSAVKSGCWVISRLILPLLSVPKSPFIALGKWMWGSCCAGAVWCCAAAQLFIAFGNILDAF